MTKRETSKQPDRKKVELAELEVTKETVRDLTAPAQEAVKGGYNTAGLCTGTVPNRAVDP